MSTSIAEIGTYKCDFCYLRRRIVIRLIVWGKRLLLLQLHLQALQDLLPSQFSKGTEILLFCSCFCKIYSSTISFSAASNRLWLDSLHKYFTCSLVLKLAFLWLTWINDVEYFFVFWPITRFNDCHSSCGENLFLLTFYSFSFLLLENWVRFIG